MTLPHEERRFPKGSGAAPGRGHGSWAARNDPCHLLVTWDGTTVALNAGLMTQLPLEGAGWGPHNDLCAEEAALRTPDPTEMLQGCAPEIIYFYNEYLSFL